MDNKSSATVIYVTGKGRSGSTLLDNALGEIEGIETLGELYHLWDWGLSAGYSCGCGRRVRGCPFWDEALSAGFGTPPDPNRVSRDQDEVLAWRNSPRVLLGIGRGRWAAFDRYVADMASLFSGLQMATGSQVFVDATKWPTSPVGLGLVPGVDPVVVQLVRDPRAVVYSWKRTKPLTDREEGAEFPRWGTIHSGVSWLARNLGAELMARRVPQARFLRIRYEDFVRDPARVLRTIAAAAGLPDVRLPFVDGRTLETGPNHTVGGNVNRLERGKVELREDDEWTREQGRLDRIGTTLITFPLLSRYGYPLRVGSRGWMG